MSVDGAACRVAGSPVGTSAVHSFHVRRHGQPQRVVVPSLEVSRGDVLQHQLVQAQFCHQLLRLGVLQLKFLQPPRLLYLQVAIPPTPAGILLLGNADFSVGRRVFIPFPTATSACRSGLTICSNACLFHRAMQGSSHTSFSNIGWYRICRAL